MATRLEAGGYAHGEMDPHDRRRVLIHASPTGVRHAFSLFDDLYAAAADMYTAYRERDLRMLMGLIRAYRTLITDHTAVLNAEATADSRETRVR